MGRTVRITTFSIFFIAIIVLLVLIPQINAFAEGETVKLSLSDGIIDRYVSDEQGFVTLAIDSEITLPTPTKSGYSFDGWTKTKNADDVDYVTTVTPETAVNYAVLYARFSLLQPTFVAEPNDITAVYDENAGHTLSVEIAHSLLDSAIISYSWHKNGVPIENANENTLEIKSVSDSGEYYCTVHFSVGDQTKQIVSKHAVVNIKKATPTDIPNVIIEGVYDSQKTLADYTLPEFFFWETPDICPDVPTRTYNATFDKGENYLPQSTKITLILQKAKQTIEVKNVSAVYDGESHSIVASATDGNIVYSDNNSLTNIGKETVIVTAEETANYLSATAFAVLEVTAQPVQVVWGDTTFVYDGESHIPEYSCISSQNVALTLVSDGANVNAGEYTATASIQDDNYILTGNSIDYVIQKQSVQVVWGDTVFVYDGESHVPEYSCISSQNVALTLVLDGANVNAGEYTATASIQDDNYTLTDNSIDYVIQKQSVQVVWGDTVFVYDGESHVPEYSCISSQNVALTLVLDGANVNAGEYTATASIQDDNYILTDNSIAFTIAKATVDETTILFEDKTVVYDGNAYSITASHVPDFLTVEYSAEYTDAGIYTITAHFSLLNDNYNEVGDKHATLTILQNQFESDWYKITCPNGIDPTVNVTLQTIDDLDGITNKEKSKINCLYGFRVLFDRQFDYDEPMIIRIKLDKADIDTLVLAVDNDLNEQIITYSYQNGSIEITISDYSANYVIGQRTHSIWWIIPLVVFVCVLSCVVTIVITKYTPKKKKEN